MANQDPLQGRLSKIFDEFVIPANVLHVCQQEKMLTKVEIERVRVKTKSDCNSVGSKYLFGLLVRETGWFNNLQIVLRDNSVKLEHIADIMAKEKIRIVEWQSDNYRLNGYTRAGNSELPTLSALYIEYNQKLEEKIRELFEAKIGDPVTAINLLWKYSKKVLTKIDADNVRAEARNSGDIEGTRLLFNRLVLYDSWPVVLMQVFKDADIRLPEVATEIELHTSEIKGEYEQKKANIEHLYQTNQHPQLAENRMDIDGSCSGTTTRARPSQDEEFETDHAEMRPAAKRQARSYENKENTVAACGGGDSQDLTSQNSSSENKDATTGKTELMLVAASGNFGSLLYLIENGADLDESDSGGRTALMYAVHNCQFQFMHLLVSRGCNVNKRDLHGCTALMIAAKKGFSACLECLIERKADVDNANDSGSTPLMLAAKGGFIDCMRLLIKSGCDVDKCHNDGRTALMFAAFNGHSECVDLLLCNGCDVNRADKKGATALMFAAKSGKLDCIRLLVNGHADLDIRDEEGNTALMYAVYEKKVECLRLLVDSQADINIANNHGYTPLKFAKEKRYKRCMKILRAANDKYLLRRL